MFIGVLRGRNNLKNETKKRCGQFVVWRGKEGIFKAPASLPASQFPELGCLRKKESVRCQKIEYKLLFFALSEAKGLLVNHTFLKIFLPSGPATTVVGF